MTDPALRHRQARWAGWASLVANIGIVVTGGAVRLTGSGLGCPTWPRCTEEDFTPRGALDFHAAIEFGNRLLTFVLVAVAVLTFVAAVRTGRRHLVGLAVVLAAGIPLQAVIGGITVLTDLNPWIVSLHLLLSMALVGLSVRFLQVLDRPTPAVGGPATWLAWTVFAAAWVVLYLGLTVGLLLCLLAVRADRAAVRVVLVLLVAELAQGTIGFVQYFTDLPEVLVGLHMLGAAVLSALTTAALLRVRHP